VSQSVFSLRVLRLVPKVKDSSLGCCLYEPGGDLGERWRDENA
jgi:hypothetical protein